MCAAQSPMDRGQAYTWTLWRTTDKPVSASVLMVGGSQISPVGESMTFIGLYNYPPFTWLYGTYKIDGWRGTALIGGERVFVNIYGIICFSNKPVVNVPGLVYARRQGPWYPDIRVELEGADGTKASYYTELTDCSMLIINDSLALDTSGTVVFWADYRQWSLMPSLWRGKLISFSGRVFVSAPVVEES